MGDPKKVIGLSILSHAPMTWMVWGVPPRLGNSRLTGESIRTLDFSNSDDFQKI